MNAQAWDPAFFNSRSAVTSEYVVLILGSQIVGNIMNEALRLAFKATPDTSTGCLTRRVQRYPNQTEATV